MVWVMMEVIIEGKNAHDLSRKAYVDRACNYYCHLSPQTTQFGP